MRTTMGHAALFRDWCTVSPTMVQEIEEPAIQEVPPPPQPFLTSWRQHRPMGNGCTPVCIDCGQQAKRKEQVKHWSQQPCKGAVEVQSISLARRFRIGMEWHMKPIRAIPPGWRDRAALIAGTVSSLLAGIPKGDG